MPDDRIGPRFTFGFFYSDDDCSARFGELPPGIDIRRILPIYHNDMLTCAQGDIPGGNGDTVTDGRDQRDMFLIGPDNLREEVSELFGRLEPVVDRNGPGTCPLYQGICT